MSSVEFGDLFEFLRNGMSVKQDKSGLGLPITRIETISDGVVNGDRVGYAGLSVEEHSGWLLQVGDILFSHINSATHVGKCAVYEGSPPLLIHGMNLLSLRPDRRKLLPSYGKYLIRSDSFRSSLSRFVNKAVNQASISVGNLRTISVHVPSLQEQARVAEILDRVELLRAKRREAIAQLNSLKQAVFREMFGNPMANDHEWPLVNIGDSGRVQLGRQRTPQYQTGKHSRPYIRVANVYADRIDVSDLLFMDFNDKDFDLYKLEHGDILLNEGQSTELVGRPAMWRSEVDDCCFQNTLVRFQADRARVLPEYALAVFLAYFYSGEFSKISSKTSNIAHLGAARFAAMPFPLPPIALQQEYSTRARAFDVLLSAQKVSLAEMDALFASLQHQAFPGEL